MCINNSLQTHLEKLWNGATRSNQSSKSLSQKSLSTTYSPPLPPVWIFPRPDYIPRFYLSSVDIWKKCKTRPRVQLCVCFIARTYVCVLQVASSRRSGTATGFNRATRDWWRWTGPWWPARAAASRPKTTSSSFRTRESLFHLNCKWDIVCLSPTYTPLSLCACVYVRFGYRHRP